MTVLYSCKYYDKETGILGLNKNYTQVKTNLNRSIERDSNYSTNRIDILKYQNVLNCQKLNTFSSAEIETVNKFKVSKLKEPSVSKFTFKITKSKIRKTNLLKKINSTGEESYDESTRFVAFILCLLFGLIGIHRFYLGYYTEGLLQLLTGGCCGIWTFIDLIRIITGDLKPKK